MIKMKKLPKLLFILFGLASLLAAGQEKPEKVKGQLFRVAFYNVENLFDTIDDPLRDDAEFTPAGRIPWTAERYQVKLDRISGVIAALAGEKAAAVIGLCEVENGTVLQDLVASPSILRYGYRVIHQESPDERGIDNALIYDPSQFLPVYTRYIRVDLSKYSDNTRDILYVKGVPVKSDWDTLHIFVNHWPSRSEGREVSEPKRIIAAETLKHAADSLIAASPNSKIIILGDFNDEPADKSISEVLQAVKPGGQAEPDKLYNLGYPALEAGQGTLYWKDWDLFDQVIVSGGVLISRKGLTYSGNEHGIFGPDWLMYEGSDGSKRPNRTAAKEYYGGYSDHLPVYLDLILRK
jgi:predicted extracellular nuclease